MTLKRVTHLILAFFLVTLLASCSSAPPLPNTASIATATLGLVKNPEIPFSLYLINQIESKQEIAAKVAPNIFLVHTGHLLKPEFTKEQNEAVLASLADKGIDLVNLTVEDFTIATNQEISLDKYPQKFLSSSVIDLNEDNFITKPNIVPYAIHEGVAFIGLSDKVLTPPMVMDKFLVSDYVLAVLRAKKIALMNNPKMQVRSYVIVHTLGSEINDLMERLPPNFINSLAN